ncbi:MAG: formate/nitrite transporter family protein [Burkholderiaceae bacterium]
MPGPSSAWARLFALIASGASLGFAATRLLGGLAFSLGLIPVIVAGAELFTGNKLLAFGVGERLPRHTQRPRLTSGASKRNAPLRVR